MSGGKEGGAGEQLHACGSRAAAGPAASGWCGTCVSVLPRRRCCAMRFKSSASSSSGAVTPWSMRTAGRPAARGRSAVSPRNSIGLEVASKSGEGGNGGISGLVRRSKKPHSAGVFRFCHPYHYHVHQRVDHRKQLTRHGERGRIASCWPTGRYLHRYLHRHCSARAAAAARAARSSRWRWRVARLCTRRRRCTRPEQG